MARRKSVFGKVMDKGAVFSFLFFLFLMMSALPILALLVVSLGRGNLPGIVLALVFAGILVKDVKVGDLFVLCRDLAVLNLTLWFLLGFFSVVQAFMEGASGFLTYALLAPYAIISGLLIFYFLHKADGDRRKVVLGGVAVSTMMAVISAINGAVLEAVRSLSEEVAETTGVGVVTALNPLDYSPFLAFLLLLVVFNVPFVIYYLKGRRRRDLWWYALPVGVYLVLFGVWSFLKDILLAGL
ncbi:hypothetical protein KY327_00655 [Candidatus Woesearchaeota archaeon]|nr:hypothetical protein [Candidatus Woesearchaeota archaeon]